MYKYGQKTKNKRRSHDEMLHTDWLAWLSKNSPQRSCQLSQPTLRREGDAGLMGARSRHQRLFKENVVLAPHASVTRDDSLQSSVQIWLQNYVFSLSYVFMYFPFFMFFSFLWVFCIFYLFVVDKGVSLAPTYSSIAMRKSDLRSSFRTKRWWSCFYLFFARLILTEQKSFKALDQ